MSGLDKYREVRTKHGVHLSLTAPHKCQTARLEANLVNQATIAASAKHKEDIIPA